MGIAQKPTWTENVSKRMFWNGTILSGMYLGFSFISRRYCGKISAQNLFAQALNWFAAQSNWLAHWNVINRYLTELMNAGL
jgi:hypothetical protein